MSHSKIPSTFFGPKVQVFSGRLAALGEAFDQSIDIEDIAHALSQQCRYNGHTERFYSVAEHSVLLAEYCERFDGESIWPRQALLHDAAEAYLGDIASPIKTFFGANFARLEKEMLRRIFEKFSLPPEIHPFVAECDLRIVKDEQRQALKPCEVFWEPTPLPELGVQIAFWRPEDAKEEFLECFWRLWP